MQIFARLSFLALTLSGLYVVACGSASGSAITGFANDAGTQPSDGATGTNGDGSTVGGACILNDCTEDAECATCGEGRTHCQADKKQCVACGGTTNASCPSGQTCTASGLCVPMGLSCATDSSGVPTITCATSNDCQACDPAHHICDTGTKKCVGCTSGDLSECQSTDQCLSDSCSPKCPSACHVDNDCGQCGTTAAPAHACNEHKCAQCSSTYACPDGEKCDQHGVCQKPCGVAGETIGSCNADTDCAGCSGSATTCHLPVGGGLGTCGPAATGCSDLGKGITLPAPYNEATNLCSSDTDCASVGISYDVGNLLRNLTGDTNIGDANITYPMHACADITIASKTCGVCVPCKVDADCSNIDVDAISGELFGTLGSVGAAVVLNEIFGPNDHKIHMFCEPVVNGYGVCAPCANFLESCSQGTSTGTTGTGSGDDDGGLSSMSSGDDASTTIPATGCDHDQCTAGDALSASCTDCTAEVCAADEYCCDAEGQWDSNCVSETETYCGTGTCTQSGSGTCLTADDCSPQGCVNGTCGACGTDDDCYPNFCDTSSGDCY